MSLPMFVFECAHSKEIHS